MIDIPILVADESDSFVDESKLLACIHCGLCLPACPTHVITGEEMSSPRGRLYLMRGVLEGRVSELDAAFREHELSCLVCRACETACPSGVEFGYLMEQTRAKLESVRPASRIERFVYQRLLVSRQKLNLVQRSLALTRVLGLVRPLRALGRLSAKVFPRISQMLQLLPASITSPVKRPSKYAAVGERRGAVGLLPGCVGDVFGARINDATIRILRNLGYDVHILPDVTCCGALAIHSGFREKALELGKHLIKSVQKADLDFYISNISGCGAMLKDYEKLFADSAIAEEAAQFRSKVRDISEFLFEQHSEDLSKLLAQNRGHQRVAYHAACHLQHAQRITEAPLALLHLIAKVEVFALDENDLCCGSAGSYNVEHPAMSNALLDRKIEIIERALPEVIVTGNIGCLMQLQKGLRASNATCEVLHIIEYLDRVMRANA
jgi:glycolate oxidase iron-sulfur subunit